MAVTPNTDLYLLKCPLEADNQHQMNFANATSQYNYFSSLPKVEAENFTYQRKDSIIRFPAHIDNIMTYNYVMYRNTAYGNKWFYAFITDMQYINDNMTAITIKTDSWQTWCFGITMKKSFVEREHVSDDTFGKHTVPENLDVGEYVCNGTPTKLLYAKANDSDYSPVVLFQVTKTTLKATGMSDYTFPSASKGVHNGIPQGCGCFGLRLNSSTVGTIHSVCGIYDSYGAGDAIVSISLVPYYSAGAWNTGNDSQGNSYLIPKDSWATGVMTEDTLARNATLDGYTPKNNKLFTGEFNYLYLSNNAGADITYHWENFDDGDMDYRIVYTIDQGGGIKLYPTNSIKSSRSVSLGDGWNEGVLGAKLPNISWSSDYYLNWKAVNGKNIEVQTALSAVGFAFNNLNGSNTLFNMLDYASNVASTMQAVRQAEMTPPQAKGNTSAGDIAFSNFESAFTFRKMSVRSEYAQRIDDYLSAFGYRVNVFKVPQYTSRASWNFLKTKGVAIEGDIPQANMQEIKEMFNNGVTMWHNPTYFMDYSRTNNIV